MKTHRVARAQIKVFKRKKVFYRELEIAMERRAIEIYGKPQKKVAANEINNWTDAEVEILES